MSKTTIWIVGIILIIFGLFVWSSKLQNSDPSTISSRGMHWHPELHIFIDGEEQELPSNIGTIGGHKPIHTHDDADKGLLHMEFEGKVTKDMIRIKEFFKIWNKDINTAFGKLDKMTVNNKDNLDKENYVMQNGDIINLYYISEVSEASNTN